MCHGGTEEEQMIQKQMVRGENEILKRENEIVTEKLWGSNINSNV